MNPRAVLVTGAAGFIGSFLCKRLLADNPELIVVGYDNLNNYYDVGLKHERLEMVNQADTSGRFKFVLGDIYDADQLSHVFDQYDPDIVVNLAAQAGVRHSIDHPRDYIDSNIVGFFNVLEQCRSHRVSHLVFASSSSVYGNTAKTPFSESEPCNEPISLYAATKKANEALAYSYASLYGMPCTGLRFFSVYGPMGRPDMAYFHFAESMVAGKPIQLFNNGNMLRDFTYIDDIIEGICLVIAAPAPIISSSASGAPPYRIFNIGHGNPVPLFEFVNTLEAALRAEGALRHDVEYEHLPMQAGDAWQTYADTSALQNEYDYTPKTVLAEGLAQFAQWFALWKGLEKNTGEDLGACNHG